MTYGQKYGLQPADRIVETITALGISKHHSIYLGTDYSGTEWMAENYKFENVRLLKASDYFRTVKQVVRVEHFAGGSSEREQAVKRALDLVGQPYSLINFNCEHYAEYVQHGKLRSLQVENVAFGFFALLFITLISLD